MKEFKKRLFLILLIVFCIFFGVLTTGFIPEVWIKSLPKWLQWMIYIGGALFLLLGVGFTIKDIDDWNLKKNKEKLKMK